MDEKDDLVVYVTWTDPLLEGRRRWQFTGQDVVCTPSLRAALVEPFDYVLARMDAAGHAEASITITWTEPSV